MKNLNPNTPSQKSFIPKEVIQQVKEIDIKEALEPYLKISKNGSGYEAVCPFHNDHSPSLKINQVRGFYKCFVCGQYGTDAINVVIKVKNVEFPDAVIMLAGDHKIEIPEQQLTLEEEAKHQKREAIYNVNQWAAAWFTEQLIQDANKQAIDYVGSADFMQKL